MRLNTIFKKPVDRPIEGVIKADDETSLKLEVEEYVLTNEVSKRLESFLYAYNNYEGANGVWISGFFGSGKSHLLKMLALLLGNRLIDGKPVFDLFLPKCTDNEILKGDLKRAVSIPSKSILFNIDQKADIISKTQIDALLSVFVKVFDEMCGYYGKQGHIAKFERDLNSRGLYEKFKEAYKEISGRNWESGREQALLESQNIAAAYSRVTGEDKATTLGILDKYRSEYKISIEDFANQVNEYIERNGKDFRLNFFVDEVGQYIADNVKLMTNLQTIAESLATKCRGHAWIIVTAQEDMNTVIGEMSKQQGNDFSKIQARFAIKMKLTSADVEEVLQKRLLIKNDDGIEKLSEIYHAQSNNFKTLFDFADGAKTYKKIKDRDHFINCYPFIPYQFSLFQSSIQDLSLHNAFEGKHSSVGERSMLAVFQQVAIQISEYEMGQLASFNLMFEGIRSALKSQIQRSILSAEKHLDNEFAIKVLKALFLIKYVKEFKPTVRNLCVLMFDKFDCDLPSLKTKIEEALNLLELQTYIQRNGEQYEFLTDEEKDIEQEIKNTDVENTDVSDELAKIIFENVIKNRKIRYENGQDYNFSHKLDDKILIGREYELAINIISPFHENSGKEDILKMQSLGRDELLVIMPPDDRLIRDILMYKKTEKYIRQNVSITQQEAVKRILTDKSFQNRERYAELGQLVNTLLSKAKLFVAGVEVEVNGEDAQSRIIKGFHELILRSYSNLQMLRGTNYTENDISQCLIQVRLPEGEGFKLTEAEQEMISFININSRSGLRTTVKSLIEKFERKSYGWYYAAILCILAKLYAMEKVELRSDSNILEPNQIEKSLRNTQSHPNIVIDPQIDFTPSQIRVLKECYQNFFDNPPPQSEAKIFAKNTATAFGDLVNSLTPLASQVSQYPFLKVLEQPIKTLKELSKKPYTFFLTDLDRQEDELMDLKEKILDPVWKFMTGSQKNIYDEAIKFLQSGEANFAYVEGDEHEQIHVILNDAECFKGNRMQQMKTLVDSLKAKVADHLENEKRKAIESVDSLKNRIIEMDEFSKLTSEKQKEIAGRFDNFINDIKKQKLIAVIRENVRRFEETEYQKIIDNMCKLAYPKPDYNPPDGTKPLIAGERKIKYIQSHSIHVQFDKSWLGDESDVERYLAAFKDALMKEIKEGKRVQV